MFFPILHIVWAISVEMGLREINNDSIKLFRKQLRMMQGRDMTCFSIIDCRLEQSPENKVRMVIVFRRKITGQMTTHFLIDLLID